MLIPLRRKKLLSLIRSEMHWLVYISQHLHLQKQMRILASQQWKFNTTVGRIINPDVCERDF